MEYFDLSSNFTLATTAAAASVVLIVGLCCKGKNKKVQIKNWENELLEEEGHGKKNNNKSGFKNKKANKKIVSNGSVSNLADTERASAKKKVTEYMSKKQTKQKEPKQKTELNNMKTHKDSVDATIDSAMNWTVNVGKKKQKSNGKMSPASTDVLNKDNEKVEMYNSLDENNIAPSISIAKSDVTDVSSDFYYTQIGKTNQLDAKIDDGKLMEIPQINDKKASTEYHQITPLMESKSEFNYEINSEENLEKFANGNSEKELIKKEEFFSSINEDNLLKNEITDLYALQLGYNSIKVDDTLSVVVKVNELKQLKNEMRQDGSLILQLNKENKANIILKDDHSSYQIAGKSLDSDYPILNEKISTQLIGKASKKKSKKPSVKENLICQKEDFSKVMVKKELLSGNTGNPSKNVSNEKTLANILKNNNLTMSKQLESNGSIDNEQPPAIKELKPVLNEISFNGIVEIGNNHLVEDLPLSSEMMTKKKKKIRRDF